MANIVERARDLARVKHASFHLFDEGRSPMFEHISEVAELVSSQGGSPEMIAAAYLHDIVEDTDVTLQQVEELFGSAVRALVDGLTDPERFEPMPLQQRKALQAERIRGLPDEVKRIKLCDQLSNVGRVLAKPPTDWSLATQWEYIAGARQIVLECRGLWPQLDARFDEAYARAQEKFAQADRQRGSGQPHPTATGAW